MANNHQNMTETQNCLYRIDLTITLVVDKTDIFNTLSQKQFKYSTDQSIEYWSKMSIREICNE